MNKKKKSSATTDVTINYASLKNPAQTVSFTSSGQTKQRIMRYVIGMIHSIFKWVGSSLDR